MKNHLILFFAAVLMMIFGSSCASLTGFEEGRTLGKDNYEIGVSANYTSAPDIFEDDIIVEGDNIAFPNIELNFKYGITDKFDVGGKSSTNLNVSTYAKYQIVGDQSSKFALSPGIEVGTIAGLGYSVGIPVYASIYPTENLAININPRYLYQFVSGLETQGLSFYGGNLGLLFGSKHKFGVDFGYYKLAGGELSGNSLLTFGLGGKFRFGDYSSSSSSKQDSKRRRRRR